MSIPLDTLTLPDYNNQQLNIRIMPMKRFQLGGVLVKSSPGGLIPKLTGPARYRGTKRIGRAPSAADQVGWHREPTLLVPIRDEGRLFIFLQTEGEVENMNRVYNFYPGPAALPLEVLELGQQAFVEYGGQGMSLLEMSHRSEPVEKLVEETEKLLLEIIGLRSGYEVLFMGGGASAQFALVPMNFLAPGRVGRYVLSGSFSEKAYQEARTVGQAEILASGKAEKWARLPDLSRLAVGPDTAYVHVTTNNTIEGSQWKDIPDTGDIPLIGDMTSDILSRSLDWTKFAMFYAGAQKNLGPAGVTAVVVRSDLLKAGNEKIPTIFQYASYAKNKSLYNTPPVHSIYMMKLMLEWVVRQGGIAELEKRNEEKAALLYEAIDTSGGFFRGIVEEPFRSRMNVTWRMKDEELEKKFALESTQYGLIGLAGHRSVGGLRASIYNAVPVEACRALANYMRDFAKRHG